MQCNLDHVQRHNAILVDLGDAIAPELELSFDRISLEIVYRRLYHFSVAYNKGKATDEHGI